MALPVRLLALMSIGVVLVFGFWNINVRAQRNSSPSHKEYLFVSTFKLTWQKAMQHCRSLGMFLVSIQNQKEYSAIKNELNTSDYWKKNKHLHMWTSLNDIGNEGRYYWASTGIRNTLDIWREGEPNNTDQNNTCTDEDCVALLYFVGSNITYHLDDRACTDKFVFMCET